MQCTTGTFYLETV